MATVLLLSDAEKTSILTEMVENLHHKLLECNSVALAIAELPAADIVIVAQQAGSQLSVEALTALRETAHSALPLIVVTAEARSDDVIEAMRLGAFDHLSEPLEQNDLRSVIERALARPKDDVRSTTSTSIEDDFFAGVSVVMRRVQKLIGIAAACEATVLVQGETGTGKSTIARVIHKHSAHRSLTVIDCTAVPEDYQSFHSLAPGASGTVILDEIGDLNSQTQALLVRALKESSGASEQPRIIATTQYDLIAMVKDKRFREDLYYRLNVLPVMLAPLRERGSDILALAEIFLQQARPDTPKRISTAAAKLLLDYPWPGNVRELENLMYHLTFAVRGSVIEQGDLSVIAAGAANAIASEDTAASQSLDYYSTMAVVEKRLLERALHAAGGSRAEAARLLGINRQLLYAKLKTHGLMGGQ